MSPDRDRKLELALKHELRAAGAPDRDGCVDAETLGAWADGGLDSVQMASVELHVSTCARCQAIVAVAAQSAPVIAPVANEGWFRFPRWALAPLAAAAAITIWMVVPQDTMQAPPAQAPVPFEARRDSAPPAAADATAQQAPSQGKELADAAPAKPAGPPETFAEEKRERTVDSRAKLEERQQRAEERTGANLGASAAAPPPITAPSPATTPPLPSAPPPPAAPAVAESLMARAAVAPVVIVSPDASRRWRIANGAIERSEDGGASWIATRALSGQTITGGTAPAGSICWLIGAGGMVMLTADGISFTEVPLPDRVDLTAITATDARTATVTTADGRRFRTDDSGRTWRQI